jgi:RHS repeat-associated protein
MGTRYVYDPINGQVDMELDDNGNVLVEYTREPDGTLISEHRNGVPKFQHYDGEGNTTLLTDINGDVTDTFAYNASGELTVRTGTTPTPYQYHGEQGYYWHENTGDYMVQRRPLDPSQGRWLTPDPLGLVDGPNPYHYVHNNPVNFSDPTGLLTVVPRTQKLGKLSCNTKAFMAWDFLLDIPAKPKNPKSDKGAPCDGYVVQHVVVACSIVLCVKGQCAIDLDQITPIEYWEAWHVPPGEPLSPEKQDRGASSNDKTSAILKNNACGYYYQTGEVKFYCTKDIDLSGWHNGKTDGIKFYGKGDCGTTPGFLLSTDERPDLWDKRPMDGPAFRSFIANWDCCPCRGIKRIEQPLGGNADASPRKPE